MKNLLYDLIVGGVILGGLIAVVPIMNANQNYIKNSAITRNDNERLEVVSDSGFSKNEYNIADVYAFVLQNTNEQGGMAEKTIINVKIIVPPPATEISIRFEGDSVQSKIDNLALHLNKTNYRFTIEKTITGTPGDLTTTYDIVGTAI